MQTTSILRSEGATIVFGRGAVRDVGRQIAELRARRPLVLADEVMIASGLADTVKQLAEDHGASAVVAAVPPGEPTIDSITTLAEKARSAKHDGYVALGGGSTIDTTKLVALMAANDGDLLDFVNSPIGGGVAPENPLPPLLAIPTTAGTGSESTPVAIVDLPHLETKTGVSHRYLRPTLGIVDPELTIGVPPTVTAASGIDAFLHAAEAYTGRRYTERTDEPVAGRPAYQGSNPFSDVLVERALELGGRYLRRAVEDGSDLDAREGMMLAATLAGMGFATAGVHIPHAFAYPIASLHQPSREGAHARTRPAHGFAVCATAHAAFSFTAELDEERHERAGRLLGGSSGLADAVADLARDIGAPTRLGELGYRETDTPRLASEAAKQQRLLALSPRPVGTAELEAILRAAL